MFKLYLQQTASSSGGISENNGKLMQTGQKVTYGAGDDITRGREVDHFILNYVNEWGHSFRWVGKTGGYTDGVNYFDVNGIAATKAAAFPSNVILDFSSRNATEILTYYTGDVSTASSYLTALELHKTSTFEGLAGWKMWNNIEGVNAMNIDALLTGSYLLNYPPFDLAAANRYILTCTRVNAVVLFFDLNTLIYTKTTTEGVASGNVFVRYTTLTELGL